MFICKLFFNVFLPAVLIGCVVIGGAVALHHAGDVVLQVSKGSCYGCSVDL